MPQVLLDPSKLIPAQPGFLVIETEIEFLRHADDPVAKLIKGPRLCHWAELYYTGRGILFKIATSAVESLIAICPGLNEEQAGAILKKYGDRLSGSVLPLSVPDFLKAVYPASLWEEPPSIDHFAGYLLWLWQNNPDECLAPIFQQFDSQWADLYNGPAPLPYERVSNKLTALNVLEEWFGIKPSEAWKVIGMFPKPIPQELKLRAKEAWKKEIITSEGEYFFRLSIHNLPFSLIKVAAIETAVYLESHRTKLTRDRVSKLSSYITEELLTSLTKKVPPPMPSKLPDDHKVISWVIEEYLPFREWQVSSGEASAHDKVSLAAREFIDWYLNVYPAMLIGHPLQANLSFQKVSTLTQGNRAVVTLIVLLDGLGLSDSRQLLAMIQEHVPKLEIKGKEAAFSPLPTVTLFCKDALLKGVAPQFAPNKSAVGKIISGGKTPAATLQTAKNGEIYIWSILEPDETYHKFMDPPVLKRNVESALLGIVMKLKDVADEVSDELTLELIITADHGRLMVASDRKLGIPEGFTSHGRAAWGKSGKEFPASGYLVEGNLVYLHASRFGLLEDAVLPINEDTFLTTDARKGNEAYSHGGLYPEEVIVPWIEFSREIIRPSLEAHISGTGYAENRGVIEINVMNLSEDEVNIVNLEFFIPNEKSQIIDLNLHMTALDQIKHELELDWWPTTKQAKQISAKLYVEANRGIRFAYPVDVKFEVKEMYTSEGPDILGDLQ